MKTQRIPFVPASPEFLAKLEAAARGSRARVGPLAQCDHADMRECCPGCGHWHCPRCHLSFDAKAGM